MVRTRSRWACALCALLAAAQAESVRGQAQAPACPIVEDQVISVASQQATAFTVGVENLGRGEVSVFQYPLGGELVAGSTPLDFVFVPDQGFVGTTTFIFRVTPEAGCPHPALLGKVTFVGPTTGRQFVSPEEKHICGAGVPLTMAACSLMIRMGSARRRQ